MKIDEACIDHNAVKLISEIVGSPYEYGDQDEEKRMTDDLISRQAAIDAISCDITITGRQNAELVAATIGAFADRIKALPSAGPISKNDLIELQDRYGDEVRFVVEDMLSGEGKRWTI